MHLYQMQSIDDDGTGGGTVLYQRPVRSRLNVSPSKVSSMNKVPDRDDKMIVIGIKKRA